MKVCECIWGILAYMGYMRIYWYARVFDILLLLFRFLSLRQAYDYWQDQPDIFVCFFFDLFDFGGEVTGLGKYPLVLVV